MKRLIKNKILPDLDLTDLNICVDSIRRKQTKHTKNELQEAFSFLKLCRLMFVDLLILILLKRKDIVTFIDEYPRYGYIYLLYEKSQVVNVLEIYLNEV